jgi:hypothetical protein
MHHCHETSRINWLAVAFTLALRLIKWEEVDAKETHYQLKSFNAEDGMLIFMYNLYIIKVDIPGMEGSVP